MRITPFSIDQYNEVIHLWQRAGIELSRSDTVEGIQKKLERDAELFLVAAAADGKMIGAVMGSYDGRRGWVNHLAVDPDCQGQDVGTSLMQELERRFARLGCEKINLLIEPGNRSVSNFYAKLGFSQDELFFMEKWILPTTDFC